MKIAISSMALADKPGKGEINWEELNDSFRNKDIHPLELCNAIYQGHPFCPHMSGRRSAENFECAQYIGVDLDEGTYESSMDALVDHPLVQQYGAIIYQTPSHLPHEPRSRVIFILDGPISTVDGYRVAIETVYSMFQDADPSCIDPVRFFFGNGKLGRRKDPSGIWFGGRMEFPLSNLRLMASQYLRNQKKDQEKGERQGERIKPKFVKKSMEQVFEKLDEIDPYSTDYRTWQKVLSGLKNEFGDEAYTDAKLWSDKPGKDPLTRKYWDSLGRSGTPVTIATVMQFIKEYGQ